jgi:hypothetical protein
MILIQRQTEMRDEVPDETLVPKASIDAKQSPESKQITDPAYKSAIDQYFPKSTSDFSNSFNP